MNNNPEAFEPFIKIKTVRGSNRYTLSVVAFTGETNYELDGLPRYDLFVNSEDQMGAIWLKVTLNLKVSETASNSENWFYTQLTIDETTIQDPSTPGILPDDLILYADKLQVVIASDIQTEKKATIIYTDPEPDDPFRVK